MPGPNGKILKKGSDWYADLDNHVTEMADDVVVEHVFKCAWCAYEISVQNVDAEAAAEIAVKTHNWCIAEDDDQVGVCCNTCRDKS